MGTSRDDCACCKEGVDAMQCGYPMHRFCSKKENYGCPGVCNNQYTLSGKGYPCYSDRSRTDCAWCSPVGWQCEKNKATGPDAKGGSRCAPRNDQKYCTSLQGDCKHIPGCDFNAECKYQKDLGTYLKYYECKCKEEDGWIGNGIQCQDINGTMSYSPFKRVEVEIKIESENYTYPAPDNLSLGESMNTLISEMGN